MDQFVESMKKGVVGLFFLGLLAYAVMMGLYVLQVQAVVKLLVDKPAYTFGLPICGATAFAIVCVLERLQPLIRGDDGKLEFKAFGLTFSGPAGPVTLWIVCYLALVASMQMVSDDPKNASSAQAAKLASEK